MKSESTIINEKTKFAEDIISEILNIVFESADHSFATNSDQIISNNLIRQNISKLHRQVFVKMKVDDVVKDQKNK